MADGAALVFDPILALAGVRDPVGVLTAMVSVALGSRSDAIPGHRVIRDALADLELPKHGVPDGEMVEAYQGRRAEIAELVEDLLDPTQTGRGRILVLPLTGAPHRVNVWESVPDGVMLSLDAHVAPLLGLREDGRPVGLVAVSATRLLVAERSAGATRMVRSIAIASGDLDPGQAGGPPGRSGDLHSPPAAVERQLESHRLAALAAHADELAQLAIAGRWWAVAICGEPARVAPLRDRLVSSGLTVVEGTATPGDGWSVDDLERVLHADLDLAARVKRKDLATYALDAARTRAGKAALGVDDVLAALVEGRVHHLVVAVAALPSSYEQMPDGRLAAAGELPAGVLHGRLRRLPGLCDRMVSEALLHDGEVTALGIDESPELVVAGGVVAMLRW
jgi:hypothetical protein